jgi:hypothetical protein
MEMILPAGVKCGAGTASPSGAPESLRLLVGLIRVGRSLIVDVVLCTSLLVIFSFLSFLPLYCLSFLDVCLLITSLVPSNSPHY